MKKIVLVIFLFSIISCSHKNDELNRFTLDDFKNQLDSEMSYSEIVQFFGEPFNDRGSGIHIYVYKLNNNTEVWIGYSGEIIYAYHVDENEEIIQILI